MRAITSFDSLLKEKRYSILRVYRRKENSIIALVQDTSGKKIICRAYDHPVPSYATVKSIHISELPEVYSCREYGEIMLVEEEFVDGISLAELMELYHPDHSQTAAICAKICKALTQLHGNSIIHRDIKPENILICSNGRVCLIDLDASSSYIPERERDTSLLGTAGYAAPEQFGFGRSDVRTDIFSLGVMMNVMLTGRHPSKELATGTLGSIIEKCIEVNADKRYSSADELCNKLAAIAQPENTCTECGFISPGGGCIYCGVASPSERRKPKRLVITVAAAICLLALGISLTHLLEKQAEPSPPLISEAKNPALSPSPTPGPTTTPEPSPTPAESESVWQESEGELSQEEIIEVYGGEFGSIGWFPTETSTLSQTEVTKFYGDVYFDEHDNPFFPSTANDMLDQFRYDLDGDGYYETYYFSVMTNIEQPRHFLPFDSVGRPFNEDDWIKRTAVPVVYKQVGIGEYEPVRELTDMLQDAKVELYYIDLRFGADADMPEVYYAPPLDGEWNNAVYIKYKLKSIGHYAVTASAKFNDMELRGYCITTLRSDWNGIEM